MASRYLLLALVACVLLAGQAAHGRDLPALGGEREDCHNSTSRAICETKPNCTFCVSSLLPSGCYHVSEARLLPKFAYTCDEPAPPPPAPEPSPSVASGSGSGPAPTPGMDCSSKMEKPDCDGDCLWCESSFGPASCYSKQQADFLPTGFFKCRKHKEDEVPALIAKSGEPGPPTPGPAPGPGASCSGATDRKACRHQKGCVWCEGSFGPASCYDEAQAKFLPKQFFKCTKPAEAVSVS